MKAAVRYAPGKLAGGEVLGMQAEVAVVGNLGFRVDPAGVVGAGCDAVFAADTAVRIHRDDVGFRIVVAGAGRADLHARRIHALLAGNADVVTFWARHALQKHTRAPWGEVICFVAGAFAFAAADAFILVEDHHVVRTDLADAQKAAEPENGIMRRGAEWCVGDLLLKSGVRIGAAETALLFEAGMDVVKARSLASVGIIATGSELRDFVCRAEGPTRVSSDAAYLRSLLLDAGIRDVWARSAADDSAAIAAALTGLAVRSDVLITIGGTGRGSKDLTRRAILEAGGKLLDSQEADRCSGGASPFIAGELDGRPVIGLPGNPLAAMMIAQRVVLPLIAARSGIALHEKVVRAAFSGNIPAGKTGELCVSLCGCGDARIARAVQKGTGSVLLLRDAAGVVKVGKDGIKAGDEVDVICFIN